MADNNPSRFRSSDPFGPGSAPSAAPQNDPLAELARLIGQNDPFAEFGNRPEHPQQPEQGGYGQYPAQPYNGQPSSYAQEPQQEPPQEYLPEPVPHYSNYPTEPRPPHYGAAPQPTAHDDWPGTPAPSYAQPNETYGVPPPMRPLPGFDQPAYSEPMVRPPDDFGHARGIADPLPSFLTSGDRQAFAPHPYAQHPPIYPPQPEAGAMPAPHDDEFYDDEPRGGRRKGLLTVAAVLMLAVVGTAGAVAYRNYFGGAGTSGPPPVIRASGEPSKVPPPPSSSVASTDPSASKFNYERFPERGKDEKIVGREEKPIDQKDLGRTPPREILPGPSIATLPQRAASNAPVNAIGNPKRVTTEKIVPNATDVAMNTPTQTPENILPPPPSRAAPEPKPEAAAPRPAAPRTVTASRPQPAPQTSGNAPLSLSPDAADQPPPPQASAYRDTTPPRQANAAPAPRATGGGRFHVQVSSQKSETDAEASYRSIQSKYSSVLGGQPHTVRRADLGAKGIYYRAMVGPFGTREQAVQLCSSLKSAGGDCVVQAN